MQTEKFFTMANDKSGKEIRNFINAWNKKKHDNYELHDKEDKIFFSLTFLSNPILFINKTFDLI